ncbi:hypothetical protein BGZ60DRAFT_395194 [Tricladium varicosporioides]|nr:hypothetical protein BGZ60DRAFT_395194 [Hymenoscyphus varicosporioides]
MVLRLAGFQAMASVVSEDCFAAEFCSSTSFNVKACFLSKAVSAATVMLFLLPSTANFHSQQWPSQITPVLLGA